MKSDIEVSLFDAIADHINRAEDQLMASARSFSLSPYAAKSAVVFCRCEKYNFIITSPRSLWFQISWSNDEIVKLEAQRINIQLQGPTEDRYIIDPEPKHSIMRPSDAWNAWKKRQQQHTKKLLEETGEPTIFEYSIYDTGDGLENMLDWSLMQARAWLL